MSDTLAGIRVVDLASGQAASVAALLLAEFGAEVTKVTLRGRTTDLSAVRDAIWNRGKIRRALDPTDPQDGLALAALIAETDILVHDQVGEAAKALGLDDTALTAAHPALIVVSVGGWPAGHAKAGRRVHDPLVLADAGLLDEQRAAAREGPVYLRFPLGSAHAAYLAAIGALARLRVRRRTGRGGVVRTSLIQGALIPMMMHWLRVEHPTPSLLTGMPKTAGATLFECGDGLWIHVMGDPLRAPAVLSGLETMEPSRRKALNDGYHGLSFPYLQDRGALEPVFRSRPRQDWLDDLWAHDVPAQPVLAMGELFHDAQAIANGYVVKVEDDRFGSTLQSGAPVALSPPSSPKAPSRGSAIASRRDTAIAEAGDRPLAGLKVLDLGQFVAGPLAPMLLADLGAEVIKLESAAGDPMRPADWAFNACHRGKRSIAVDLKQAEGRRILSDLIGWADVVHHNQRLPAAEKLGFGAEAVRTINPDAVYAHVSSYGPAGARAHWPGYDQLFQAASGWEYEGAGEGNPPMWHRFGMMDHLCALASTTGVLLALLARDETGEARGVTASLLAASLFSCETLILPTGEAVACDRLDRDQTGVSALDRLYQTADGWVALDGPIGAEPRLFQALDCASASGAEAALGRMTTVEALERLRGLGLDAEQARQNQRDVFFDDTDNRAAGLVGSSRHPQYGRVDHVGALWDFGDLRADSEGFTPLLGEHSREILDEMGYRSDAIEQLIGSGTVVADRARRLETAACA